MRFVEPIILTVRTERSPQCLVRSFARTPGVMWLAGQIGEARFQQPTHAAPSPPGVPPVPPRETADTLLVGRPFLRLRSWGRNCELIAAGRRTRFTGDPWEQLTQLWTRYTQPDPLNLSFPLGGCFGVWGYDLKNLLEPRLTRKAARDLNLPDCDLGFHHSLAMFQHAHGEARIIATGLAADGSRSTARARQQAAQWRSWLESDPCRHPEAAPTHTTAAPPGSTFSREGYLQAVARARRYIRSGDIYQVNLAQRLTAPAPADPLLFFEQLRRISPTPFATWFEAGAYQIASVSPELFLRCAGQRIVTRPIKGTRPRFSDPVMDARSSAELRAHPKEQAELLMITDLMRNDLGRVCDYGSVTVPELLRLEPFAQVHHLVATVQGRLRPDVTHPQALAACFPGGSVTGAPKIRAMEIIDELEPVARGPYTGALGYLGFNGQSQLSMIIRTALLHQDRVHFPVGAGIVADSDPAAEYEETLVKARAFLQLVTNSPNPLAQAGPPPSVASAIQHDP